LHDPKLNGDCPVEVAWFFLRLLAILEGAKSQSGQIALDRRGLNFCAAREQHRHALRVARIGAARGLYALSTDGVHTLITVPNWAEIQGYASEKPSLEEREEREEKRESTPAASPPLAPNLPLGDETPNPAGKDTPQKLEDRPESTNSESDAGVQQRGDHPPADADGPVTSASRRKAAPKRKTQCPEALTAEQWSRVHRWRSATHPEFSDKELEAQWTRHYQHHAGKGNTGLDWVLSFYNWLTGPYYTPIVDGRPGPPRPTPPVVKREEPPPPMTEEESAAMSEQYEKDRIKYGFRPRGWHDADPQPQEEN